MTLPSLDALIAETLTDDFLDHLSDHAALEADSVTDFGARGDRDTAWFAAIREGVTGALLPRLTQREAAIREEAETYKTLAKVGTWHDDCRPNREMAARELQKSQAIIDKLADTISELEADLSRLRAVLEGLKAEIVRRRDAAASSALRHERGSIAYASAQLRQGSWESLLDHLASLETP